MLSYLAIVLRHCLCLHRRLAAGLVVCEDTDNGEVVREDTNNASEQWRGLLLFFPMC